MFIADRCSHPSPYRSLPLNTCVWKISREFPFGVRQNIEFQRNTVTRHISLLSVRRGHDFVLWRHVGCAHERIHWKESWEIWHLSSNMKRSEGIKGELGHNHRGLNLPTNMYSYSYSLWMGNLSHNACQSKELNAKRTFQHTRTRTSNTSSLFYFRTETERIANAAIMRK